MGLEPVATRSSEAGKQGLPDPPVRLLLLALLLEIGEFHRFYPSIRRHIRSENSPQNLAWRPDVVKFCVRGFGELSIILSKSAARGARSNRKGTLRREDA